MKTIKCMIVGMLLAAGAAQASTYDWAGAYPVFAPAGDTTWNNPDSWRDQSTGLGGVPVAGDLLFVQRYWLGNTGFDITGSDSAGFPIVDSAVAADTMWIAHSGDGIGQAGQLDLVSGGSLTLNNLSLAYGLGSTAILNMSGDAVLTMNAFFNGRSTSSINMSGTSALNINVGMGEEGGDWGFVLADDAVVTFANALPGYANTRITALNPGESIQATDLGGSTWQYTVIPEPATLSLFGVFGAAFVFARRRLKI